MSDDGKLPDWLLIRLIRDRLQRDPPKPTREPPKPFTIERGMFGRPILVENPAWPAWLRGPALFARWLGGRGRLGHRGPLKTTLAAMIEQMESRSFNSVLRELHADSLNQENVLTGLREAGATDLRVVAADETTIRYEASGKTKSVTLRRLENLLSEIRTK